LPMIESLTKKILHCEREEMFYFDWLNKKN
jgi:hypothetical protein